ncbi:MAG: hypothetical protein NTX51_02155 [Verrucomicrobia bacterium]|nr:hypothetical protein [Verrucomicrobiota bacterium]
MINRERIERIIHSALDEWQQLNPDGAKVAKVPGTVLFGEGSTLDSLGLVTLIAAVEREIAQEFDRPLTLVSEKAMSQRTSPFRTVATLTDYIASLLEEDSHG